MSVCKGEGQGEGLVTTPTGECYSDLFDPHTNSIAVEKIMIGMEETISQPYPQQYSVII